MIIAANVFDDDTIGHGYPNKEYMKKIKKRVNKARSKSDSNQEYQYSPIDEFLINTDMNAEQVAKKAIEVASEICVFTNNNIKIEKI